MESIFLFAIFAVFAFSVSAESVAVKPAKKPSKVVKRVKTETTRKTKRSLKSESALNKTNLNAQTAKRDETSPKPAEKPPAKLAPRDFESDADHQFRKDMVLRLNEIIKKTQKESPAISAELNDDRKISLLKVFTAALGDGVEYVPALDFKQTTAREPCEGEDSYKKSIIISSGKVLYLRIDAFNKLTVAGLRSDSASIAESASKPLGMVVDLRWSHGVDYNAVADALDLFIVNPTESKSSKRVTGFFKLPVIMLVDVETRGAAEVFAAATVKAGRGICLGEPTAGAPFEKKRIMLANGDFLMIPVISKKFAKFASCSLTPDIRYSAHPRISYEKLKTGGGSELSDKCVARAVELLICLNAISTTQNKTKLR